jgi:hypothetical protein
MATLQGRIRYGSPQYKANPLCPVAGMCGIGPQSRLVTLTANLVASVLKHTRALAGHRARFQTGGRTAFSARKGRRLKLLPFSFTQANPRNASRRS